MSSAVFAILILACMAIKEGDWGLGGGGYIYAFACFVLRKLKVLFSSVLKIGIQRTFWLEFIQLRLYWFRTTWILHRCYFDYEAITWSSF